MRSRMVSIAAIFIALRLLPPQSLAQAREHDKAPGRNAPMTGRYDLLRQQAQRRSPPTESSTAIGIAHTPLAARNSARRCTDPAGNTPAGGEESLRTLPLAVGRIKVDISA